MSDQSFLAKLDNMKDYRVLTVADLVSILAGQPPMMEVYLVDEDGPFFEGGKHPHNLALFINGIESTDESLYLYGSATPKVVNRDHEKSHEEQLADKKNMALHMQRESEKASRMPEVVE